LVTARGREAAVILATDQYKRRIPRQLARGWNYGEVQTQLRSVVESIIQLPDLQQFAESKVAGRLHSLQARQSLAANRLIEALGRNLA
jgi:hypothetical protein